MHMRKLMMLFALLFAAMGTFAQGKSDIISRGIEVRRYFETDVANAGKEYIFKEEFYNFQGEIAEQKEYSEDGKVTLWLKYKYDQQANIVEEIELDSKGKQRKRIVHKYDNGLRIAKEYYDSKDRMYQIRRYEYEYRR